MGFELTNFKHSSSYHPIRDDERVGSGRRSQLGENGRSGRACLAFHPIAFIGTERAVVLL